MKKRLIVSALLASMVIVGLTACNKKPADDTYMESRVLYSESDTETTEDTETESSENADNSNDSETETESKSESEESSSSKSESSKKAESKTPSATASKKPATASKEIISSKASVSKTQSSSKTETSSKESSAVSSSTDTSTDSSTESDTETNTEIETETDTTTDTDTAIEPEAPFDEDEDLQFSYNGYMFNLRENIEDIVDVLGEPDDISILPLSNTGEGKLYSYESRGFEFATYPDSSESDRYIVYSIRLISDYVLTEKNISVGSPEEDIFAIYGEENCVVFGNVYRYYSRLGTSYLQFTVEGGEISDILITRDE